MTTVLVDRDGDIAVVTINRPEKLNALTRDTWERLGETVAALSGDDSIRCVVLRGAGGRSFSPGNDISEFETERSNVEQARRYGAIMRTTLAALQTCRHPTVAMINGICVGGGLEIAACTDIRICGESSRFGIPINRLGLVMGYSELQALLGVVGRTLALEILLEGRIFSAAEAKEKGLVTRIVADDQVAEAAMESARRIAAGAPLVNRWHKKFLRRLADPAALSDDDIAESYACFATEDFRTGYKAFLAKEPPLFVGK